MHCLLNVQPTENQIKRSVTYKIIFLFQVDKPRMCTYFEFVYDDILEPNAVVERRSHHFLLPRSRLFIGYAFIGVTAYWLTKCKHKPRNTEVGAPI